MQRGLFSNHMRNRNVLNLTSGRQLQEFGTRYNELIRGGYRVLANGNICGADYGVTNMSSNSINDDRNNDNNNTNNNGDNMYLPREIMIKVLKCAAPNSLLNMYCASRSARCMISEIRADLCRAWQVVPNDMPAQLGMPSRSGAANKRIQCSICEPFAQVVLRAKMGKMGYFVGSLANCEYGPHRLIYKHRLQVAQWMYTTCDAIYNGRIFALAIALFDKYSSIEVVGHGDIQLFAMAAMFLASTALEDNVYDINEYNTHHTLAEIKGAVGKIVTALDGGVLLPVPYFALWKHNNANLRRIMILCALSPFCVGRSPLHIADAILVLSGEPRQFALRPNEISPTVRVFADWIEIFALERRQDDAPVEIDEMLFDDLIKNSAEVVARGRRFIEKHPVVAILPTIIARNEIQMKSKSNKRESPNKIKNSGNKIQKLESVGAGINGDVQKHKIKSKHFVMKNVVSLVKDKHCINEAIQATCNEIAALCALRHSNCVNIRMLSEFDWQADSTKLWFRFVPHCLRTGALDGEESDICELNPLLRRKYFMDLARAVNICHYYNIIHRDIKPQNILFDGETLSLIDFGLCVPFASLHSELAPEVASTLWYRAPEALIEPRQYDKQIDIWALGMVYYEIIVRRNLIWCVVPDKMTSVASYKMREDCARKIHLLLHREYDSSDVIIGGVKLVDFGFAEAKFRGKLDAFYDIVMSCLEICPRRRCNSWQLLDMLAK